MMVESSRRGEVAAAGSAVLSKAFKRSWGKRRRGEPVRHVAGDEQHPLLRGTPRTPVGGERLDKHGALSDGPSAALSGPSTAHSALPPQRAAAER